MTLRQWISFLPNCVLDCSFQIASTSLDWQLSYAYRPCIFLECLSGVLLQCPTICKFRSYIVSSENLIFSCPWRKREKCELLTLFPLTFSTTQWDEEIHHYLSNQAMISVKKRRARVQHLSRVEGYTSFPCWCSTRKLRLSYTSGKCKHQLPDWVPGVSVDSSNWPHKGNWCYQSMFALSCTLRVLPWLLLGILRCSQNWGYLWLEQDLSLFVSLGGNEWLSYEWRRMRGKHFPEMSRKAALPPTNSSTLFSRGLRMINSWARQHAWPSQMVLV